MSFGTGSQSLQDAKNELKIAQQKIIQAQQKIDNRDLDGQLLLQQALEAVDTAQQVISNASSN